MLLSKIKNLIAAPEDGLSEATAIFSPPVIWVEADEDGVCSGDQTWSVGATMMLNGTDIGRGEISIVSAPSGVNAFFVRGVIAVMVQDGAQTSSYVGEIKIRMSSTYQGKQYNVVKSIPVQDKRKGADGNPGNPGNPGDDGVSYEIVPSENMLIADYNGNVLTGEITTEVYRSVGKQRALLPLGSSTQTDGLYHWIQYRRDGGQQWYLASTGTVSATAVRLTTSTLELRLVCSSTWGNSTPTVLKTYPALKVVKHGTPGGTGKTGPWWMPQGSWDSTVAYERTDDVIPVVEHNGEYWYIATPNTIVDGVEPTASSTEWKRADRFQVVFMEALFAAFAKLGSAIMNGDWIMSQYGTLNGGVSNNYRLFDASDPEGKVAGHFCPNWAVDLLRGKGYMDDAVVRGVLKVRAIYTITGVLKTVSGKQMIDLENNPGNAYVIPGNTTVYLPEPTDYEGLTLTILFRAGGILACSSGIYTAYYSGTTAVQENGMSVAAFHSTESLAVLTVQAISAYGPNSGVKWVVVGQRGLLGIRNSLSSTADQYQLLPDGRMLI